MSKRLGHIYHDLASMIGAGIPLLRALESIASRKGQLPAVFARIAESVRQGDPIAERMADSPRIFKPFDIGVVRVGEETGLLSECLTHLGQWHDFAARQRATIISGCVYPFLVLHMGALIAPLPAIVVGGSGLLGYLRAVLSILSIIYVPVFAILLVLKAMPRRGTVRFLFDSFVLRIPVVGKAMFQLALSRFSRAFAIASGAGVPYVRCIQMAVENTANEAVARMFQPAIESAAAGNAMSEGFSKRIPPEFLALWEVGEETGDLDEATARLAKMTGDSAEMYLAELARWLPRIIYFIVMGIMAYQILKTAMGIYGNVLEDLPR